MNVPDPSQTYDRPGFLSPLEARVARPLVFSSRQITFRFRGEREKRDKGMSEDKRMEPWLEIGER